MALPKFVNIKEVGPREGMQFEKGPIATADKIRLVDMLSECNFKQIEVTSFVSPKWVPQMADADEVARAFKRRPGTEYSCIFLNAKGLERAAAHALPAGPPRQRCEAGDRGAGPHRPHHRAARQRLRDGGALPQPPPGARRGRR